MKYFLNAFLKGAVMLAAVGTGLFLSDPVSAEMLLTSAQGSQKDASETVMSAASIELAQQPVVRLDEQGLSVQVQLRGAQTHEISFMGSENERVVAYWDTTDGALVNEGRVFLLDEAGNEVAQSYFYATGVNFDEISGSHRTFVLPKTGQYRLVMDLGYYSPDADSPPRSYALTLRVAPYFERLMIYMSELFDAEQYEAALPIVERAIAHNPDHPLPYFARVFITGQLALADQSEDFLLGLEETPLPSMYELFQALEPEEQQRIIADLRRAGDGYVVVVEQGLATVEEFGLDPIMLHEAADFVETGVASDAFEEFVELFF